MTHNKIIIESLLIGVTTSSSYLLGCTIFKINGYNLDKYKKICCSVLGSLIGSLYVINKGRLLLQ